MVITNKFKRVLRKAGRSLPQDPLAQKQKFVNWIKDHTIDGKVGMDWTSMDCDGGYGAGHSIVEAHWWKIDRWLEDFYNGAEGPQTAEITYPRFDEQGRHTTRDLAMEAHENGHDHILRP